MSLCGEVAGPVRSPGAAGADGSRPADSWPRNAGVTAIIDNQVANAESTLEQGVRADGRYTYDAGGLGRWELSFSGNYLLVDRASAEAYFPQLTNVTDTIAEPPKFRLRGGVTWQYRNLTADLMLYHTGAYQNTLFSPAPDIASWTD